MTRIHCLTTFKDGADTFHADDTRTVDDERAARFIAHGWAARLPTPGAPPEFQTLTAADVGSLDTVLGIRRATLANKGIQHHG